LRESQKFELVKKEKKKKGAAPIINPFSLGEKDKEMRVTGGQNGGGSEIQLRGKNITQLRRRGNHNLAREETVTRDPYHVLAGGVRQPHRGR